MYAIKARVFLVYYLFKCRLEPVGVYVHLRALFEHSKLFLYCLSIHLFCYDRSVPIFYTKIVLPLSYPVVDMAWHILPLIVGRIFFPWFSFLCSCFVYIVWSCLSMFLLFLLSLVFFSWSPQVFF